MAELIESTQECFLNEDLMFRKKKSTFDSMLVNFNHKDYFQAYRQQDTYEEE